MIRKRRKWQTCVPTAENAAVNFWMKMLVKRKVPVMLVGPAGCGKSTRFGLLHRLNPEETLFQISI